MLNEVSDLFGSGLPALPPADRRAMRRFADVWSRASRGQFPAWEEIRRFDLGEDWNWAFAVDLKLSAGFPYFIYLGPNLAKLSDVYLTGDADWTVSVLDKATAEIDACIAAEAPHFSEDALTLYNGRRVLFRSVTAPLAEDGVLISHAAGVVSGTIVD